MVPTRIAIPRPLEPSKLRISPASMKEYIGKPDTLYGQCALFGQTNQGDEREKVAEECQENSGHVSAGFAPFARRNTQGGFQPAQASCQGQGQRHALVQLNARFDPVRPGTQNSVSVRPCSSP